MAAERRAAHAFGMHASSPEPKRPFYAARELRSLIVSARDETENARKLAPKVVTALIDSNLFRLAVPRSEDGLEAAPLDALDVFEELARAEASVAWIVWNNTLPALMSRFLGAEVRQELFSAPQTVTANSTRPSGRATRCEDGFRVSGRWSLVSGCELAEHLLLRCVVAPASEVASPTPELLMVYLPARACRVLDTWHAGGLRGTGSHDVLVEDELVPAARAVSFSQPPELRAPLYRMPFAATLSAGCAAICLGIAQNSIDSLLDLTRAKVPLDGGGALRDRPALQAEIARLMAAQGAARLLLHSTLAAAWRACTEDRPVTLEERAAIWAASAHVSAAAREVARRAYACAGATALYASCPLERAHRDIHAVCQHVILSELWLEDAGKVWLGSKPVNPMFAS
jgi:indole-3-acetate monooxygenase